MAYRNAIWWAEVMASAPGYSLYVDPGVAIVRGRTTWTLNVPVRIHQNFKRSLVDEQKGTVGGGDLAAYLFLATYRVRFGGGSWQ
jgi:hypothetical protein